jgi:ABC-type Fe3+-hydroxamate transport system substrate-binding protein
MFKNLVIFPVIALILALAGCEAPKNSAIDSAISDAKAAMAKADEAAGTADAANKTAQRAEAMTEQNRSALRALNDKIDRMFRTISRK